jgi:hypothetical protein
MDVSITPSSSPGKKSYNIRGVFKKRQNFLNSALRLLSAPSVRF